MMSVVSAASVNEFFGITADGFWREVLAGEPGAEITAALKTQAEAPLAPAQWREVISGMADRAKGLFDVEVIWLIASGWGRHRDLMEYTMADRHNPRDTQLVPLEKHTVRIDYSPFFEVLFGGQPLGKIVFDVSFSFDLERFVLTIQNGKVMKARTGVCTAEGRISFKERCLVEKQPTMIGLPPVIHLGDGVALPRSDLEAR